MTQRTIALALVILLANGTVFGEGIPRDEIERKISPMLASPSADGLLIFHVEPGSQSEKAGFTVGDIVTHYDGQPVSSVHHLAELLKSAALERRGQLLVLVRRGEQELQGEFDPAPLGVRLVGVKKDHGRNLWRPATRFRPATEILEKGFANLERWETISANDAVVGWARSYFSREGERLRLRVQSQLASETLQAKRDVIVTCEANGLLSPRSLWLSSRDKLVLDVEYKSGKLEGRRVGLEVKTDLPADAISTYLAGQVARLMPHEKGACQRCSMLEDASLVAAPFADIYCSGTETLTVRGKPTQAYCYEQSVFGEVTARYWVDSARELVQVDYGNGLVGRPSNRNEILKKFPDALSQFDPIDRAPVRQADAVKAN